MPIVHFGTKNEPATNLNETDEFIAVRTIRPLVKRSSPVLGPLELALPENALMAHFPEANVSVYRVQHIPGKTLAAAKESLKTFSNVRFAGRVLVDDMGEPVVYTENIFIKFSATSTEAQCLDVIAEHGLKLKRKVEYAANAYFVSADGAGREVFNIAERLLQRDDVEFSHPEIVRKRVSKGIFPQQWHLAQTKIGGKIINAHADVITAHKTTTGSGVTIAIIDDGVDIDHPEFANRIVAPRDVTLKSSDPRPKDPDKMDPDDHGTACAGVACAAGTHGACGVAPDANLMPIRLSSALGSEHEAQAFQWAADNGADIISCSWGPRDGDWSEPNDPAHTESWPIPASTRLAIDYATSRGRHGLGCIVLFAAGNGNEDVAYDGYASYSEVIAVAACNDRGVRSCYSDFGNAIWCCFPSNDFEDRRSGRPRPLTAGIWTTDRSGAQGYNVGQNGDRDGFYTNDFGGTSSACPGVAGVIALILSLRPHLTRDAVKDVLRQCCEAIDLNNGDYNHNGWSRFYGWGRINAARAVAIGQESV